MRLTATYMVRGINAQSVSGQLRRHIRDHLRDQLVEKLSYEYTAFYPDEETGEGIRTITSEDKITFLALNHIPVEARCSILVFATPQEFQDAAEQYMRGRAI